MNSRFLLLGLLLAFALPGLAALVPGKLRCEYRQDPLGIEEAQPRLSWILNPDDPAARGLRQTAYRVLVASSPELLAREQGDLWDSGQVASGDGTHIEYAGKRLASRQRCFWMVRSWDQDGQPSAWSVPAVWTMGLLKPEDWQAKWIRAVPAPAKPVKLVIAKATYAAVDGSGAMEVTAKLASLVEPGGLSVMVNNNTFGRDPIYGKVKRLQVSYELDGVPGSQEIQENQPLAIPDGFGRASMPPRYLRKPFAVAREIRQATLYATALGLYELSLNGKRVGDHVLAPDWTDCRQRLRYQVYDVTGLLRPGDNVMGALLGNGWYSGHIGNGGFQFYGRQPALLAQLEITYADGYRECVVSDGSWMNRISPILASDFMLGEAYDARLELPGWNQPGPADNDWVPVAESPETPRLLNSQVMEPVRQLLTITPKTLSEPKPGQWTFDLGQNMVGVVRLTVSAPAGTKLVLRHAEMLNPDGTLYVANLRAAPSVDTYVCKGGGVEVWQPRFTFHGFRYVELSGLPAKPSLETLAGVVIASDTPRTGEFACSDPRLNQLQSNIQWGQRGNYLSVPTDCPQRDERLGWMGDAQVFVRTATYNADVAAFFSKWLVDVDDAQSPEGSFSDVSPNVMGGCNSVPAWGDAGVICPWALYQAYGDKRLLERHLPAMRKWVDWCQSHSTRLIRDRNRGNDYGDWLSIGANTPKDLIGTAFFAYSTRLTARACQVVGQVDAAAKYEQLFQEIKTAFNQKFVAADGRILGNTQCGYAMALKFDLLPAAGRALAAQYLEDDIRAKGNHLSTGFIGVSYLLPELTAAGKLDTAFSLLTQDTFPSWLFSVKHGATTIWERWDGWTPERGFQDPGMNSFNHYSLGSCGEWLFSTLAGIDADAPGFKHIVIRPHPGGGITWARASYESIQGRIATAWKLEGAHFILEVTIPPNTAATIFVPSRDAAAVQEGGQPALAAKGLKFLRMDAGCALFEAGSGSYSFKVARESGK